MKTAREIRDFILRKKEKERKDLSKAVFIFCDDVVQKAIDEKINVGESSLEIEVPYNIPIDMVISNLRGNGYACCKMPRTRRTPNSIEIGW